MTAWGAITGTALDQIAGEPPIVWHPVARFGSAMQFVERYSYRKRRSNGVAHLMVGAAAAAVVGSATRRLFGRQAGTAIAVEVCAAGRMLDDEARATASLLHDGDIDGARNRVRSLVGRDTSALNPEDLSRAVIESVAENLVDAVTATILWGSIAGPTGAFLHRAVNTLDAMVGHRNERYELFGWASARFDDLLNFVPARVTALAIAAARPSRARHVWDIVRRDAPQHPSPNGGVVEAAFAAALGISLGGVNRYGDVVEDRGVLGDGRGPGVEDIDAAIRLRRHVTMILCGNLAFIALVRTRR